MTESSKIKNSDFELPEEEMTATDSPPVPSVPADEEEIPQCDIKPFDLPNTSFDDIEGMAWICTAE